MKTQKDVICIGLCCVDISVMGFDLDVFFKQEATKPLHTRLCVGGDAINQSIILSRLGAKVSFMGNVGNDDAGRCIRKCLEDQHVDIADLRIREDCPTSTVILMLGDRGKRHMCTSTDESSNRKLDIDNVRFEAFQGARAVSFCSMFCFPKINDEKLMLIFKKAKKAGAYTFADNKLNKNYTFDTYRNAMCYLDYLFINQEEAEFYSGCKQPESIAQYFLNMGIGNIIVKLGGRGSYVANRHESHYLGTFDVPQVDTNGAGDNFAAGFISSVLNGKSLYDSMLFATATAGLAVSSLGSSTGVKSMEQVLAFLDSNRLK